MDLRQRSAQALEEERKRSKNLQEKNGGKNKEQRTLRSLLPACTLPRYFANNAITG